MLVLYRLMTVAATGGVYHPQACCRFVGSLLRRCLLPFTRHIARQSPVRSADSRKCHELQGVLPTRIHCAMMFTLSVMAAPHLLIPPVS